MSSKHCCPRCNSENTVFSKTHKRYTCAECDQKFSPMAEKSLKRIFLSYGHDEYAALAVRLKKDLEERGHEVWFDFARIKPGTPDWAHYIEQGIDWVCEDPRRGLMLFLVTPHSARRPDGFCLDELRRARSRKLEIVPAMVVWCELPLEILRFQWLNMQDCVPVDERRDRYAAAFERLCEAVEYGRIDMDGAQARLSALLEPGLLSFEADIERHLRHFEGRQWLLNALDRWLSGDSGSRIFWIIGKPGTGKSAIAAWLCRKRPEIAAFHLCTYGDALKSDPRRCVLSIAYQLSTQLHEYLIRLNSLDLQTILAESNPQALFDALIAQPVSLIPAPDRRIAILIDGLDEAARGQSNQLASFLASGLDKTPAWLRLIVTSRPDPQVRHPLQAYSPFEMDTHMEENQKDLRAYLAKHLTPFHEVGPVPEKTIQAILARSEGLFLYVHWIIEELKEGRLALDRLDRFPQGLGGCYAQFFKRQFPLDGEERATGGGPNIHTFESHGRSLLEIMAAAREPLQRRFAASVLGWKTYDMKRVIESFGSLILSEGDRLKPFHRTVMEWLTDEKKAGPYFVSVEDGHERLADFGQAEYHRSADCLSDYSRACLPAHLIAMKRWKVLEAFLSDPLLMQSSLAEEKQYELLSYWLDIGDNLDMVPHYQEALERYAECATSQEDVASLTLKISDFLRVAAKYDAAVEMAQRALGIREDVLGPEHIETADCLRKLGVLLAEKGDYDAAEPLFRRALAIREKALGSEHPHTAQSLNSLAMLLSTKRDYDAAEPLYRRALAIREKALGLEHPDTAQSLNNLANLLSDKGDNDTAEPLHRRALAIREKALGLEHPDTAQSLNNLANRLSDRGDNDAAEPLHRRALAIREKTLGLEHPDTAWSLYNLANLLSRKGDYDAAEPLYRRALAIREKALGPEHPYTALSLNNLAVLLSHKGDYDAAEPLYRRALAITEKTLGPEHPHTALSLNNLAILLNNKGDYDAAEPLSRKALAIREKTLGPEHPDTASSLDDLANLLSDKGDYEAAEPLYRRALAIREKALGLEHPDTASSLNNLAILLSHKGDFDAAEPLYRRALAIWEKVLGPEHQDTALSLNNLANLLSEKRDYDAAEPLYRRALAISEKVLGPEHPHTAQSLNSLASLLIEKGDFDAAEPLDRRALAIREEVLGPEHPHTASSLQNLAVALHRKNDYLSAEPLYRRALTVYEKVFGVSHSKTIHCRNNLDLLLRSMRTNEVS